MELSHTDYECHHHLESMELVKMMCLSFPWFMSRISHLITRLFAHLVGVCVFRVFLWFISFLFLSFTWQWHASNTCTYNVFFNCKKIPIFVSTQFHMHTFVLITKPTGKKTHTLTQFSGAIELFFVLCKFIIKWKK